MMLPYQSGSGILCGGQKRFGDHVWHLGQPRTALKSQIHVPFSDQVPDWYDLDLARKLQPWVLEGYVVFDPDRLSQCIEQLRFRFPQVRVKTGQGATGLGRDYGAQNEPVDTAQLNLKHISTYGVVVEKNLISPVTYSFTSFILPQGTFQSVGIIVTANHVGDEQI